MKKVLIVIGQLRVGGVAKALVNLLNSINDLYDISLLCFDCDGAFFKSIPENISVLEPGNLLKSTEKSVSQMAKISKPHAILRFVFSGLTKFFGKKTTVGIFTKLVGKIEGDYDTAISYIHPMSDKTFCNLSGEVVLNCVRAKNKAVFIHCDFKSYGGNCAYNIKLINSFDKVVSVSEGVQRALLKVMPEISNKALVVKNCHNFDDIISKSKINPVQYNHKITFVTVARLSEEKGLLRCVKTFAELKQSGADVGWHIIGDGPVKSVLNDEINTYSAEDCVILEGEQTNPYRFMVNADYLLVPSFHEAAPVVFDEARAVNLKVLTTRTLSADEMVAERGIGYVCDNNDEALDLMIKNAVENHFKIRQDNLLEPVVNNDEAIRAFCELCE